MRCDCKECREYNTLKAILKRANDFIRWKEVLTLFIIWTFWVAVAGIFFGTMLTLLFNELMMSEGGLQIYDDNRKPIIKHIDGCDGKNHILCIIQH